MIFVYIYREGAIDIKKYARYAGDIQLRIRIIPAYLILEEYESELHIPIEQQSSVSGICFLYRTRNKTVYEEWWNSRTTIFFR